MQEQLVPPACLELPLLDPQVRRELRIVAAHLLDESLGVLATDERLERVPERELGREGVVDDGVDEHQLGRYGRGECSDATGVPLVGWAVWPLRDRS